MTIRIFILCFAVLIAHAGFSGAQDSAGTTGTEEAEMKAEKKGAEGLAYCPICGPEEELHGLSLGYRYKGKKYKFCSMECLKAFKADPEKFLSEDYQEQGHVEAGQAEDDHAGHDH